MVASDAVPTPASTITGTLACSTIKRMFTGFWMPSPDPMSEPSGNWAYANLGVLLALVGSFVLTYVLRKSTVRAVVR